MCKSSTRGTSETAHAHFPISYIGNNTDIAEIRLLSRYPISRSQYRCILSRYNQAATRYNQAATRYNQAH